jgi:YkoY family integral membrane protein
MEIQSQDFLTIGLLVFLEGILSVDNAVVLAILAGRLPRHLQKKALTYGLVGALIFRAIALGLAAYLMKWVWVKYLGGAYLLYVAIHHWIKGPAAEHEKGSKGERASFWKTIIVIELTDLAFAVDSILAAVAVSNKYWVVLVGGILGVVMMRFAATLFMKLLKKFPNFEESAFILVFIIGIKLIIDGLDLETVNFHSPSGPAFWIFWLAIISAIGFGFRKKSI